MRSQQTRRRRESGHGPATDPTDQRSPRRGMGPSWGFVEAELTREQTRFLMKTTLPTRGGKGAVYFSSN